MLFKGNRLLSVSYDRTLQIYDGLTGTNLDVYRGHTGGIWGLAVVPGSSKAYTVSDDRTIGIWNLDKTQCFEQLKLPDGRKAGGIGVPPQGDNLLIAEPLGREYLINIYTSKHIFDSNDKFIILHVTGEGDLIVAPRTVSHAVDSGKAFLNYYRIPAVVVSDHKKLKDYLPGGSKQILHATANLPVDVMTGEGGGTSFIKYSPATLACICLTDNYIPECTKNFRIWDTSKKIACPKSISLRFHASSHSVGTIAFSQYAAAVTVTGCKSGI